MKYQKSIHATLPRICSALDVFIKENEDHGLLSGYCGTSLFYAYYYRLTGKSKYVTSLNFTIDKTVKALTKEKLLYSHCSGISGIAWCIQHLAQHDFIALDDTDNIFEDIDAILFDVMKHSLSSGLYDFLHEGLGIMLHFLDKPVSAVTQHYLEQAVILLEDKIIIGDNGISWQDNFTGNNTPGQPVKYNLGLAHGVPAILSILSMLYEKGIAVIKLLPLIESGVNWLISNKNDPRDSTVSLYPTIVTGNDKSADIRQSRLGWCYGDLGIAISLWNIGTRLQNNYFKKEAYITFEHILKNRNVKNGSIVDASLCHGSMGVSHIYRRAYLATLDNFFLAGADQWLSITLQMADWKGSYVGFKYATTEGYQNNFNLLEGITGIGLALIAAADDSHQPSWDRCLLLS